MLLVQDIKWHIQLKRSNLSNFLLISKYLNKIDDNKKF